MQGESDRVVWPAMFDLADRLPAPWVMIGGQMVILHGLLADRSIPRVTKDIDLLFDVRFTLDAFPRAHAVLKKLGYEVDGVSADGKAHRYLHPGTGMVVDILAPDKLGARAAPRLRTPAGKIVSIPGGKTALDDARPLTATYGGKAATLYLPGLAAALVVISRSWPRSWTIRTRSSLGSRRSRLGSDVWSTALTILGIQVGSASARLTPKTASTRGRSCANLRNPRHRSRTLTRRTVAAARV
ncbi:hypothetical protein BB31_09755 [Amycolatopsis lurida NRRL 2430]|uniref:Uncharacterized protein n=1 Tax=Amycolatopsis lurida NRRL 2430 TaxID=1460371 RepID=A0A2P2FY39_AMYLU|nr:hypothetical protein BB31_09755 [Amycolatopsis lurida NRRL 2430]